MFSVFSGRDFIEVESSTSELVCAVSTLDLVVKERLHCSAANVGLGTKVSLRHRRLLVLEVVQSLRFLDLLVLSGIQLPHDGFNPLLFGGVPQFLVGLRWTLRCVLDG